MKSSLYFSIFLICIIKPLSADNEIIPEKSTVSLLPVKFEKASLDQKNIMFTEKMSTISDIIINDIADELKKIKKVKSIQIVSAENKTDTSVNTFFVKLSKARLENYIDSVTSETFYNMKTGVTFTTAIKDKEYREKIRFNCKYEIINSNAQPIKRGNVKVKVDLPASALTNDQRNWKSISVSLIHQIFDNTPFIEQKMDAHDFK